MYRLLKNVHIHRINSHFSTNFQNKKRLFPYAEVFVMEMQCVFFKQKINFYVLFREISGFNVHIEIKGV
jgi:hypothetical protein